MYRKTCYKLLMCYGIYRRCLLKAAIAALHYFSLGKNSEGLNCLPNPAQRIRWWWLLNVDFKCPSSAYSGEGALVLKYQITVLCWLVNWFLCEKASGLQGDNLDGKISARFKAGTFNSGLCSFLITRQEFFSKFSCAKAPLLRLNSSNKLC